MMTINDETPAQRFACVWDALADSPGEAASMRLRSDLLRAIQQAVADWNMPPALAARRLAVTRPRLDELMRGQLGKFGLDELIALATQAGLEVRVQMQSIVE